MTPLGNAAAPPGVLDASGTNVPKAWICMITGKPAPAVSFSWICTDLMFDRQGVPVVIVKSAWVK